MTAPTGGQLLFRFNNNVAPVLPLTHETKQSLLTETKETKDYDPGLGICLGAVMVWIECSMKTSAVQAARTVPTNVAQFAHGIYVLESDAYAESKGWFHDKRNPMHDLTSAVNFALKYFGLARAFYFCGTDREILRQFTTKVGTHITSGAKSAYCLLTTPSHAMGIAYDAKSGIIFFDPDTGFFKYDSVTALLAGVSDYLDRRDTPDDAYLSLNCFVPKGAAGNA